MQLNVLEQPETKQDVVQRKSFLGDQQGKLEDALATIGNFWVCTYFGFFLYE